jgi:outer membrane protein insertion porin family
MMSKESGSSSRRSSERKCDPTPILSSEPCVASNGDASSANSQQTTDVYDTDLIEADRDLIRRFYLTHDYADVRVVSATGEYDPAIKGFIITFTIEEGALYHFGNVEVQSNILALDPAALQGVLRMHRGDIYNGDAVEKTVEDVTVEITKHGYPFAAIAIRKTTSSTSPSSSTRA